MKPDNGNFEETVRETLRRENAPPGFAAKVLARTLLAQESAEVPVSMVPKQRRTWLQRPFTLAVAAAVAAVAIVPAVVMDYQRREEAKGIKAKQDLLTALAITRDQLQQARAKVQRNVRFVQ